MAYATPTSDDLALLLGVPSLDEDRAALVIRMSEGACRGSRRVLPDGAEDVVLAVAARVFGNPQAVSQEALGPYSVGRPVGLTKQERAQLRGLDGSGGAYSIDPTPVDAGPANVWAQVPLSPAEAYTTPPYYGDFDQTP